MSGARTQVLDPTGTRKSAGWRLAPRPEDISGLTVGLVDMGRWSIWEAVFQHYKEVLKERYAVGDVIYVNQERQGLENGIEWQDVIDDLARKCDVVILGLGSGGSCTAGLVLDGIEFEKKGVPAAAFITEWFRLSAAATAKGLGLPDLNFVTVPHPFDNLPEAEAIEIADQVLDKAVAALTQGGMLPLRRRASTPNEGRGHL